MLKPNQSTTYVHDHIGSLFIEATHTHTTLTTHPKHTHHTLTTHPKHTHHTLTTHPTHKHPTPPTHESPHTHHTHHTTHHTLTTHTHTPHTHQIQVLAGLAEEEALHPILLSLAHHIMEGRVSTPANSVLLSRLFTRPPHSTEVTVQRS